MVGLAGFAPSSRWACATAAVLPRYAGRANTLVALMLALGWILGRMPHAATMRSVRARPRAILDLPGGRRVVARLAKMELDERKKRQRGWQARGGVRRQMDGGCHDICVQATVGQGAPGGKARVCRMMEMAATALHGNHAALRLCRQPLMPASIHWDPASLSRRWPSCCRTPSWVFRSCLCPAPSAACLCCSI